MRAKVKEVEIDRMIFFDDVQRFEVPTVTHWQSIIPPPKPLY